INLVPPTLQGRRPLDSPGDVTNAQRSASLVGRLLSSGGLRPGERTSSSHFFVQPYRKECRPYFDERREGGRPEPGARSGSAVTISGQSFSQDTSLAVTAARRCSVGGPCHCCES